MNQLTAEPMHDYGWRDANPAHTYAYLLRSLAEQLPAPKSSSGIPRALDLGCGNGWLTAWLAMQGCDVVGVDPSLRASIRLAKPIRRFVSSSCRPLSDFFIPSVLNHLIWL